jgi:hypothetical protein
MKKLGVLLSLSFLAVVCGNALAQTRAAGDGSVYFTTYFSNANTSGATDAVLRIINDGDASTSQVEGVPNGTLYASIYVLNDSEEMQECCSCPVTADGLLSESVNKQLTANTLTGREEESRGVIKVISSSSSDPTANVLKAGLRGWMTHVQGNSNIPEAGPFYVTEAKWADSNLGAAEQSALQDTCAFIITLGSGYGICSCTLEDYDF